jgi:hypothetical protein
MLQYTSIGYDSITLNALKVPGSGYQIQSTRCKSKDQLNNVKRMAEVTS